MSTLDEMIRARAQDAGTAERPALLAPGRQPLSYAQLHEHCAYVARCLASCGVKRGDCVVVVLPNGPEMAACFLSVARVVTCAPLNPAYKASELDFYFDDLAAKALIIDPALPSAAGDMARARGIPVLELHSKPTWPAGRFELSTDAASTSGLPPAPSSAIALALHTSGTTSRPKLVPLSQANLFASAGHIAGTLELTVLDRCLNIMPLFHIHGLIGVLLASVRAGASVLCSPGFDTGKFFEWLSREQPTWVSAVPTMYEAIASHAAAQRPALSGTTLRLLRSSSASMPPPLMAALEQAFGVPVVEAYGMTEASHQMASNPLPPLARKPGSVGRAAGPEISIMHPESSALLSVGETGEIVIRGPNVTTGYAANPQANATAFCEGWFRTGDQGYFDEDGYLFISGRLKEQINRGGEKIAPREIDEAILGLPGVRQAVVFGVPHKTLGEDLAAAVVLREGSILSAEAIRTHLAARLAPFKVPARIVFLQELPKGPTGKLQRIGLAQQLASHLQDDYVAPSSDIERQLAEIWAEVLKLDVVGIRNNFFTLGGDSLQALTISARAAERGLMLPVDVLFREPTIERLASHVRAVEDFSSAADTTPGPITLYGFQRLVAFPGSKGPESFSSPSEAVFEFEAGVDRAALARAIRGLCDHHDAFRLRYVRGESRWTQELAPRESVTRDALDSSVRECAPEDFRSSVAAAHRNFDLTRPPLFRFVVSRGAPGKLAIVAHHLVSDAMSLRILAEDLEAAYCSALRHESIALPAVSTPVAVFMRRYERAVRRGRFVADQDGWTRLLGDEDEDVPMPDLMKSVRVSSMLHRPLELGPISARIMRYATENNVPPRDVLLAASVEATADVLEIPEVRVLVMSNGREQPLFGDLSRTVGCLVNLLPLRVSPPRGASFERARRWMTDAIKSLPTGGFSIPAVYLTEPSDLWLRIAMLQVASHLFVNYKGVLGPRSALAPTQPGIVGLPCTYDTAGMMAHVQPEHGELPPSFALQLHFEQVGDSLFGDLYCATDLYDARIMGVLAQRLNARLQHVGMPAASSQDRVQT
jgi:acyl-CoA synthetase (AMP-forming)/AMP-acid ligase II